MRLIDADKLKQMRFSCGYNNDDELLVPFRDVVRAIDQAPTVDMVGVRHGEWIGVDNFNGRSSIVYCNQCGERKALCALATLETVRNLFPYCEKCGADMKGKGEDNGLRKRDDI